MYIWIKKCKKSCDFQFELKLNPKLISILKLIYHIYYMK